MDTRTALTAGTVLSFSNHEGGRVSYIIRREIGRGGSCIAYDAAYRTNLGDDKIVRVKECYPFGLRIERDAAGHLKPHPDDRESFQYELDRMRTAFLRNNSLFAQESVSNSVLNTVDYYEYGGTAYVVSVYLNGETLSDHKFRDLGECCRVMRSAAKAIRQIHNAGYLYLDLKPDNVLVIHGTTELVQLFDFDSLVEIRKLREGADIGKRISYTRGFAPLELRTGDRRRLDRCSDVYGIGAVLFYLMFDRTPGAFDCDEYARYKYEGARLITGVYPDELYRELTEFFHRTLAGYAPARYPDMDCVIAQLETIIKDCDEMRAHMLSSVIRPPRRCFCRTRELDALSEQLDRDSAVVSLCGMGGIGKTTVAMQYLCTHRSAYDTVLYTGWTGTATRLITDDEMIRISTIRRTKEETVEDYYTRKLRRIRQLTAERRVILVIDNFDADALNDLEDILSVSWKVLLISRKKLPGSPFEEIEIGRMPNDGLIDLFENILGKEIDESNAYIVEDVIGKVDGHTLSMELVAEQIRNSYITLEQAHEMLRRAGAISMTAESVSYRKDGKTIRGTMKYLMDHLFEADRFAPETMTVIHELALFDGGVDSDFFRELTEQESMRNIRPLIDCAWVRITERRIDMHPLIREYIAAKQIGEKERIGIERMMENLYLLIRKEGGSGTGLPDCDRQTPKDYEKLRKLLDTARGILDSYREPSTIRHRLLYHLAMDAPVDREAEMLDYCKEILRRPELLDSGSILRLYSEAAFLLGRMEEYKAADEYLNAMWTYLGSHPGNYYRSLYYRTKAILCFNQYRDERGYTRSLRYFDRAIPAARDSRHPNSRKELAACLIGKTTTLLSAPGPVPGRKCDALLREAGDLIDRYTGEYDYERYLYFCILSLYHARVTKDTPTALRFLHAADHIADVARDSDLSWLDHIAEERAPLYRELRMYDRSLTILREAIAQCDAYDTMPYKRAKIEMYEVMASVYYAMGDADALSKTEETIEALRSASANTEWREDGI